jgi:cold shock CspA family protein
MSTDTKRSGTISNWVWDRGFGFILETNNSVQTKYYLHVSRIISGTAALGAKVLFDVAPKNEGRLASAVNVEILSADKAVV